MRKVGLFRLVLLLQASRMMSTRISLREQHLENDQDQEEESLCIGCTKYPEAPDYEDDWMTEIGLSNTLQNLTRPSQDEDADLTEEEKVRALKTRWNMAAHGIFDIIQGQACMDLCAICMPSKEELIRQGDPKGSSVHITRARNAQDASIWPMIGTVDSTLGAVMGTVGVIPIALVGFFVGGGVTGAKVEGATGNIIANKTTSSFAGNVLGAIAGITTGTVSGAAFSAVIEVLGLAAGLWKGVGLTKLATDCKRVGFERFERGRQRDQGDYNEQPFTSKSWSRQYGLKRLRQWMKDNEDWRQNDAREEIFPGDAEAIHHCERVREHSFDMRHATECLRHSQLCGPGGALVLPVSSQGMCQKVSNISYLEAKAVEFSDRPEEGLFAQWRKMQEQTRSKTGFDGKKEQCLRTLCEYGGFRMAALKLHPDRIMHQDMPDDDNQRLANLFTFLSSCKAQYTGADGGELTLNDKGERESSCTSLS